MQSKRYITLLELQFRGPLRMSKFSSDSAFLSCVVFLTDSHNSHERFAPSHGLDLPSLSNWGKKALTKWSLRLLAFLKPIIGTSEKTLYELGLV